MQPIKDHLLVCLLLILCIQHLVREVHALVVENIVHVELVVTVVVVSICDVVVNLICVSVTIVVVIQEHVHTSCKTLTTKTTAAFTATAQIARV